MVAHRVDAGVPVADKEVAVAQELDTGQGSRAGLAATGDHDTVEDLDATLTTARCQRGGTPSRRKVSSTWAAVRSTMAAISLLPFSAVARLGRPHTPSGQYPFMGM